MPATWKRLAYSDELHVPVTVSAPITLSGQALALANNAVSPATITAFDIGTLANSDTVVPTSKAVVTAIGAHAGLITGVHGLVITAGKTFTLTESLTLNALPIGGLAVATSANTLGSLAVGVAGQYLSGGGAGTVPSWATLNQAAVSGLTTGSSPEFVTVKLSGLTDGYIPYHISDAAGLSNSPIFGNGTNVGIGTTNPSYRLVVSSATAKATASTINVATFGSSDTVGTADLLLSIRQGGSATQAARWTGIQSYESGYGVQPLVLQDLGGNVGIGTTIPNARLSLGTAVGAKLLTYDDNGTIFAGFGVDVPEGNAFSMMAHSNGFLTFGKTGNSVATMTSGYTEWMRITNSGNVGIGTKAPENRLDFGTIASGDGIRLGQVDPGLGTTHKYIGLNDLGAAGTFSGGAWLSFDGDNAGNYGATIQTQENGIANHQVTFKYNGNVGIGCAPSYLLHASRSTNGAEVIAISNVNTGASGQAGFVAYASNAPLSLYKLSSGYTTNGCLIAGRGVLDGDQSTSGLAIGNYGNAPIVFFANGYTERARMSGNGSWYIGCTSNDFNTLGMTINQGAADNEIFSLKSSDVAHGMTLLAETDTFGLFRKKNAIYGGLEGRGFSSGIVGISLVSFGTTPDTTVTSFSDAAIAFSTALKSGTSATSYGADDNILSIVNLSDTKVIVKGDGRIWQANPAGFVETIAVNTAITDASPTQTYYVSGNITITLPAAATKKLLRFAKTDSNATTVTIQRAGSDTIEGNVSEVLINQYQTLTLGADGTATWFRWV